MADSNPQPGIGALTLHGVEIALMERRPSHGDWMEVFSAQSLGQFMETLDAVQDNFEFLMRHHERRLLLWLLIALTAKLSRACGRNFANEYSRYRKRCMTSPSH